MLRFSTATLKKWAFQIKPKGKHVGALKTNYGLVWKIITKTTVRAKISEQNMKNLARLSGSVLINAHCSRKSFSILQVKHFDRRRKYDKFKEHMEKKDWKDPLADK